MSIHTDAQTIIQEALTACLPDQAVRRALEGRTFGAGRVFLVAAGKAAWQMADCAARLLGDRLEAGVVVTKHGHSRGEIPRCAVYEGGHPRWCSWCPAGAPPCLSAPLSRRRSSPS